ncbi:hypothetical protein [Streptomyces sp. NPDC058620]
MTDEAHLFGLLTRFQSLGLHVLEMRQMRGEHNPTTPETDRQDAA